MIDLTKLTPQMVSRVELDTGEDTCVVEYSIPTETGTLSFEETFEWSSDTPPKDIKLMAAKFVAALVEETKAQRVKEKPILCETCSGKCCGRHFGTVRITPEDIDRMRKGGLDISKSVVMWDGAPVRRPMLSIDSTVGYMAMKPWRGYSKDADEEACTFLTNEGCSIYEHRPTVCRQFSAYGCEVYEADPDKVAGRVRLPVVK